MSDEEQLEANRPPPALSVVWHKVLDYGPGLVTRTWFDPDFGYMARVMWQRDLEFKDHPVNRLQSLPKEP
jgi:hypothetical protein